MTEPRQLAPMIFFGTDQVRNDSVRDFRPTAASAVVAEEKKKSDDTALVEEQFSAPEGDGDSDPKDPDPETVAKVEHPADAESATVVTPSPTVSHPDLDALFGD